MILLAGVAAGVFVYFLVGFATGYAPNIKVRRFRPRTQISNRQLWLNQAGVEVTNTQYPFRTRFVSVNWLTRKREAAGCARQRLIQLYPMAVVQRAWVQTTSPA